MCRGPRVLIKRRLQVAPIRPFQPFETVQLSSDPRLGAPIGPCQPLKLCNCRPIHAWEPSNCATVVFGALQTAQQSSLGPCKLCNCRLWGLVNYATVVFGALHTVQLSSLGLWGLANRATVSNSRPCECVAIENSLIKHTFGSFGSPPPPHFDPTSPLCDTPAIFISFWNLPGEQIVKTCDTISESIRDIIGEIIGEIDSDQFK